jgi:hypothetical protein
VTSPSTTAYLSDFVKGDVSDPDNERYDGRCEGFVQIQQQHVAEEE